MPADRPLMRDFELGGPAAVQTLVGYDQESRWQQQGRSAGHWAEGRRRTLPRATTCSRSRLISSRWAAIREG